MTLCNISKDVACKKSLPLHFWQGFVFPSLTSQAVFFASVSDGQEYAHKFEQFDIHSTLTKLILETANLPVS